MTKVSDHNSPSPQVVSRLLPHRSTAAISAAPSMSRFPTAPFSPEQRRGGCDIRVIRGSQQKGHARNHAWLSCQSVPGPPFGGITRIRFKGSAPKQFGALSATRLPRTFFLAQNKTPVNEVNAAYAAHFSMTRNAIGAAAARGQPADENLSPACCRLYVAVENGHPFPILLFPHGSGIVGTGHILAFVGAFDLHLVRRDDDIFFIGEHVIIADLE